MNSRKEKVVSKLQNHKKSYAYPASVVQFAALDSFIIISRWIPLTESKSKRPLWFKTSQFEVMSKIYIVLTTFRQSEKL